MGKISLKFSTNAKGKTLSELMESFWKTLPL